MSSLNNEHYKYSEYMQDLQGLALRWESVKNTPEKEKLRNELSEKINEALKNIKENSPFGVLRQPLQEASAYLNNKNVKIENKGKALQNLSNSIGIFFTTPLAQMEKLNALIKDRYRVDDLRQGDTLNAKQKRLDPLLKEKINLLIESIKNKSQFGSLKEPLEKASDLLSPVTGLVDINLLDINLFRLSDFLVLNILNSAGPEETSKSSEEQHVTHKNEITTEKTEIPQALQPLSDLLKKIEKSHQDIKVLNALITKKKDRIKEIIANISSRSTFVNFQKPQDIHTLQKDITTCEQGIKKRGEELEKYKEEMVAAISALKIKDIFGEESHPELHSFIDETLTALDILKTPQQAAEGFRAFIADCRDSCNRLIAHPDFQKLSEDNKKLFYPLLKMVQDADSSLYTDVKIKHQEGANTYETRENDVGLETITKVLENIKNELNNIKDKETPNAATKRKELNEMEEMKKLMKKFEEFKSSLSALKNEKLTISDSRLLTLSKALEKWS